MAISIAEAILQINPKADVRIANNDIDRIDWTIEYWDETEKKDKNKILQIHKANLNNLLVIYFY